MLQQDSSRCEIGQVSGSVHDQQMREQQVQNRVKFWPDRHGSSLSARTQPCESWTWNVGQQKSDCPQLAATLQRQSASMGCLLLNFITSGPKHPAPDGTLPSTEMHRLHLVERLSTQALRSRPLHGDWQLQTLSLGCQMSAPALEASLDTNLQ